MVSLEYLISFLFVGLLCIFGNKPATCLAQGVNATSLNVHNATSVEIVASGVKGLWQRFIMTFSKLYNRLRKLFAITKQDFLQKVNDTRMYLALAIKHKDEILSAASNRSSGQVKMAFENINAWFAEANEFHDKILGTAEEKLSDLQKDWMQKMRDHWNKGMDKLIQVGKNIKADEGKGVEKRR